MGGNVLWYNVCTVQYDTTAKFQGGGGGDTTVGCIYTRQAALCTLAGEALPHSKPTLSVGLACAIKDAAQASEGHSKVRPIASCHPYDWMGAPPWGSAALGQRG